uniref:Uncharacterized protein n=1 Tax=Setaria italica TaxID=4555 RepID=K3ZBG3_SETIT
MLQVYTYSTSHRFFAAPIGHLVLVMCMKDIRSTYLNLIQAAFFDCDASERGAPGGTIEQPGFTAFCYLAACRR